MSGLSPARPSGWSPSIRTDRDNKVGAEVEHPTRSVAVDGDVGCNGPNTGTGAGGKVGIFWCKCLSLRFRALRRYFFLPLGAFTTLVVIEAVLLAGFGSGVSELTVAVVGDTGFTSDNHRDLDLRGLLAVVGQVA